MFISSMRLLTLFIMNSLSFQLERCGQLPPFLLTYWIIFRLTVDMLESLHLPLTSHFLLILYFCINGAFLYMLCRCSCVFCNNIFSNWYSITFWWSCSFNRDIMECSLRMRTFIIYTVVFIKIVFLHPILLSLFPYVRCTCNDWWYVYIVKWSFL